MHGNLVGHAALRTNVEQPMRVQPALRLVKHLPGVGEEHQSFAWSEATHIDQVVETLGNFLLPAVVKS